MVCPAIHLPGGNVFDDVRGHNTPAGSAERAATLEFLVPALPPVHGELRVTADSLPTTIGRKR